MSNAANSIAAAPATWLQAAGRAINHIANANVARDTAEPALPARYTFVRDGDELLKSFRAQRKHICLALFEISAWRAGRDSEGRPELLREFAARLQSVAGEIGLLGRTSPGEFALLMPRVNEDFAKRILRDALGSPTQCANWTDRPKHAQIAWLLPPHMVWGIDPDGRPLTAWLDEMSLELADVKARWRAPLAPEPRGDTVPAALEEADEEGDTQFDLRDWNPRDFDLA